MSRRAAIVEEFDDDTDLPLPSRPLANTGTLGAILEALSDESEDEAPPRPPPRAGPASPSQPQFRASATAGNDGTVKDITPYKKCVKFCGDVFFV